MKSKFALLLVTLAVLVPVAFGAVQSASAQTQRTAAICRHYCDWLDGNACGVDHQYQHVYHDGAIYTCLQSGWGLYEDYQWYFDWGATYG